MRWVKGIRRFDEEEEAEEKMLLFIFVFLGGLLIFANCFAA